MCWIKDELITRIEHYKLILATFWRRKQFSPKGCLFFLTLKNQKNPNWKRFWPDWAKTLFILLYGTPKLMDFHKKISYIKICSRVFFTPRVFFNDNFLCIPLHILYIFSTTWKFVLFLTSFVMIDELSQSYQIHWIKGGQNGMRALFKSNIFHKVSKL